MKEGRCAGSVRDEPRRTKGRSRLVLYTRIVVATTEDTDRKVPYERNERLEGCSNSERGKESGLEEAESGYGLYKMQAPADVRCMLSMPSSCCAQTDFEKWLEPRPVAFIVSIRRRSASLLSPSKSNTQLTFCEPCADSLTWKGMQITGSLTVRSLRP